MSFEVESEDVIRLILQFLKVRLMLLIAGFERGMDGCCSWEGMGALVGLEKEAPSLVDDLVALLEPKHERGVEQKAR